MASEDDAQKLKTVHRIQTAMAFGYSGMGAWCLLQPSSVIGLSLNPPYALVNRTADMSQKSFTIFGLAMIPYVAFNFWFGLGPGRDVFTPLLWLDFVGNMVFGLGSLHCGRLLGKIGQSQEAKRSKD
ncbi:hypothetical protein PMG11_08601 [Penicillium brasilianum]|uniref:Uncharacterized protein n=1 Tax=Penicillium brasilianum TaxID=104259 RepID=A0A0F7TXB8_PENBI|nr:hypothetical protein PMG11_08601 [Penicillium brasilianum]